jgi:hypothetical protein
MPASDARPRRSRFAEPLNAAGTNPATRLHSLFTHAIDLSRSFVGARLDLWAQIFSVEVPQPHRSIEVAHALEAGIEQVELLRRELEVSNHPETYYAPHLAAVTRALSVEYLHQSSTEIAQLVNGVPLTLLEGWGHNLPNDVISADRETVSALRQHLNEFREELDRVDLPFDLYDLLVKLVAEIDRALREHPVRGPEAFVDAYNGMVVQFVTHPDLAAAAEKSSLRERIVHLADDLKKASEGIEVVRKGALLTYETGVKILPWLGGLKMLMSGDPSSP